jgi:hypothetical protein
MSELSTCKPGDLALIVGSPHKKPYWLAEIISTTSHFGQAHIIQNLHTGKKSHAADYGQRYTIAADQVNVATIKAEIQKTGKTFNSLQAARNFLKKFQ